MDEIDITICPEKKKLKEYQKNYREANKKLWFLVKHYINFYGFNIVCFMDVLLIA